MIPKFMPQNLMLIFFKAVFVNQIVFWTLSDDQGILTGAPWI